MTYAGPKPALYAALTTLATALEPFHGHPLWVSDSDDDPWSGHWASDPAAYVPETPEARAERIAAAVAAFRAGLDVLAAQGDVDAARIRAELTIEDAYAAAPKVLGRRSPEYGVIVHAAMTRLDADANPPQLGDTVTWCPTCKRRRVVEEVDPTASAYVGTHEVQWTATHLACGHTLHSPQRIVGASPGGEAAAEALAGDATRRRLDRAALMQDGT